MHTEDKVALTCMTDDVMEKEVRKMVRCIQLDIDCADICVLTSHYLSRSREFASSIAKQCALICDACAEECQKHPDMPHCVECAKVCRKWAQESAGWEILEKGSTGIWYSDLRIKR